MVGPHNLLTGRMGFLNFDCGIGVQVRSVSIRYIGGGIIGPSSSILDTDIIFTGLILLSVGVVR